MVIAINKSRRFRGNGNDRQSPGQMHGSARKREIRAQRHLRDAIEADLQGISVIELRIRRLRFFAEKAQRQRQLEDNERRRRAAEAQRQCEQDLRRFGRGWR